MPRGTQHPLTGILRWTRLGYKLEIVWRLDIGRKCRARRDIGQRVIVEGIRSGFDLLDVRKLRSLI